MKLQRILSLTAVILFTLSSCSEENVIDETGPVITIHQPSNHQHFDMGSQFVIDATFEDETELTYFHIHLGDQAGNHVPELDYEETGILNGTTYHYVDTVQIPDSLGNMYWLHIDVVDTESNMTNKNIMLHFD